MLQSYCLSQLYKNQVLRYYSSKKWVTLSFIVDNTPNVGLDHLENHQLQSKESETDKIQGERGKLEFLCQGKYKHLPSVSQTM